MEEKEKIELFESFCRSIDDREKHKKEHFNLLSVMQLLENAHTNILWEVLKYKDNSGNHPFFESFIIDFLKLNIQFDEKTIFADRGDSGTQYNALSNDGEGKDINGEGMQNNDRRGFIDLLIKDNDTVIIIENKVLGAGDGDNQLARYYYSFVKFQDDEDKYKNECGFLKEYDSYWDKGFKDYAPQNVYMVYLTNDDSKKPSTDSLPAWLHQKLLNTKPCHLKLINYYDLLWWLKEKVISSIDTAVLFKNIIEAYADYMEFYMLPYDKSIAENLKNKDLGSLFELLIYKWEALYDENKISVFRKFIQSIMLQRLNNLIPAGWYIYINHFKGKGYIKIYTDKWNEFGYHFELNDGQKKGCWQLHREKNISKTIIEMDADPKDRSVVELMHNDDSKLKNTLLIFYKPR